MERDYGKEIDELRALLMQFINPPQKQKPQAPMKNIETMPNMHPDKRLAGLMEELCQKADADDHTGAISSLGVYKSGGRQFNWIRHQVNTDVLLSLIESNAAVKMLACIGNNDRLNMLLALLRSPRTVAQLVEECGYNTTGQVYHHLKPLLAADLVREDSASKGVYAIPGHRVQGIIMLLAGISDMLDPDYTIKNV